MGLEWVGRFEVDCFGLGESGSDRIGVGRGVEWVGVMRFVEMGILF